MKKAIGMCIIAIMCSGCINDKGRSVAVPVAVDTQDSVTTIDTELQANVDSFLTRKMKEINALQGQAIVMEASTGHVLAMVGRKRVSVGEYVLCDHFALQQEPGSTAKVPMLLAALETGCIDISDTVDVGHGVWFIGGRQMKDHNWRKSGYGRMTYEDAIVFSSNVGIAKAVWTTFEEDENGLFRQLLTMSYGQPDTLSGITGLRPMVQSSPADSNWVKSRIAWHAIGYEHLLAPIQLLTFYNAIANDGKMVCPTLMNSPTAEVINEQIASKENVRKMQNVLAKMTADVGLGKLARSEKTTVALNVGTAHLHDEEYHLNVCGYVPAECPQYSIIISVNKEGLPASAGGMLCPVFKEIAEWLHESRRKL